MKETVEELKREKIVFLLADPKFNTAELYRRLADLPGPLQVAVCENLGYPDERIVVGDLQSIPEVKASLYSLLIGNF
jgi:cobalt-precorrin-7 (C5)-methyltransferase